LRHDHHSQPVRRTGGISAAIGEGWGAAVDLDDIVALGIAGRGAEPGDYDLVPIKDLTAYPSRY